MKRLLVCIGLLVLVFSNTAFAEKITVTATGYHTMGETESKAQAKEAAKLKAMKACIEHAGVRVTAHSTTEMHVLTEAEIKTYASMLLQIQSETVEQMPQGDTFRFAVTITALIDTRNIETDGRIEELKKRSEQLEKNDERIEHRLSQVEKTRPRYPTIDERTKQIVVAQADSLVSKGLLLEATDVYSSALNEGMTIPEFYYQRGIIYCKRKDYTLAVFDFREADTLESRAVYLVSAGIALVEQDKYSNARTYFNEAVRTTPDYALGWANKACIEYTYGETQAAIEAITKAVSLSDDGRIRDRYTHIMDNIARYPGEHRRPGGLNNRQRIKFISPWEG